MVEHTPSNLALEGPSLDVRAFSPPKPYKPCITLSKVDLHPDKWSRCGHSPYGLTGLQNHLLAVSASTALVDQIVRLGDPQGRIGRYGPVEGSISLRVVFGILEAERFPLCLLVVFQDVSS